VALCRRTRRLHVRFNQYDPFGDTERTGAGGDERNGSAVSTNTIRSGILKVGGVAKRFILVIPVSTNTIRSGILKVVSVSVEGVGLLAFQPIRSVRGY